MVSRLAALKARERNSASGIIGDPACDSRQMNRPSRERPASSDPQICTVSLRPAAPIRPAVMAAKASAASTAPSMSSPAPPPGARLSGTRAATTPRAASVSGTQNRNTARHDTASTSQPPSRGAAPPVSAAAADQMPRACPRSARGKEALRWARLFGATSAAPTPCRARATINATLFGASPAASEASVKRPSPTASRRRRPRRSPSAPPTSVSAASASVYTLAIHCIVATGAPSAC